MTDTTVYVVDEGERQPWSETEWISPPIIVDVFSDSNQERYHPN